MNRTNPIMVKKGDLLGYRGLDFIGSMIRFVERDILRGEPRSVVNHYGIITEDGTLLPVSDAGRRAKLVEALTITGVVEREVCAGYPPQMLHQVQILRPLNVDAERLSTAVEAARGYVGRPYGWLKIFGHLFHLEWLLYKDSTPICTWVVAKAYERIGLDFGMAARRIGPDDIDDFARANPDKYQIIRDVV